MATVYTIVNSINYATINFCQLNELDMKKYLNLTIDSCNISESHILVDISSYVNHCLQSGISTINLMLGTPSNNLSLHFDKENIRDIPRLIVIDESCDSLADQQAAISLSIRNDSSNTIIQPNDTISFHTIDAKTTSGIEYSTEEGELLILRTGFYLFHWHLNMEGSTYIALENVGLRDNSTGLIYPNPIPTSI